MLSSWADCHNFQTVRYIQYDPKVFITNGKKSNQCVTAVDHSSPEISCQVQGHSMNSVQEKIFLLHGGNRLVQIYLNHFQPTFWPVWFLIIPETLASSTKWTLFSKIAELQETTYNSRNDLKVSVVHCYAVYFPRTMMYLPYANNTFLSYRNNIFYVANSLWGDPQSSKSPHLPTEYYTPRFIILLIG